MKAYDHFHDCVRCVKSDPCLHYTAADCLKKGVFKAVQVNHDGPFCDGCRRAEMAKRYRENRKRNRSLRTP